MFHTSYFLVYSSLLDKSAPIHNPDSSGQSDIFVEQRGKLQIPQDEANLSPISMTSKFLNCKQAMKHAELRLNKYLVIS